MRLPHRLAVFTVLAVLTLAPAFAQTTPPPAPSPEVQRLAYWIGSWAIAGDDHSTSPASKFTGVVNCKWFTGNAVVICEGTPDGEPPEMHIWSYSRQEKAYNWYFVGTTGAGRTVRKITLDGTKWSCDYDSTFEGKPAKLHFEWNETSPASVTYQMFRTVGDGPRTLVFDVKMTKKSST